MAKIATIATKNSFATIAIITTITMIATIAIIAAIEIIVMKIIKCNVDSNYCDNHYNCHVVALSHCCVVKNCHKCHIVSVVTVVILLHC